jgi:outer membrane protein assembly factor BamB
MNSNHRIAALVVIVAALASPAAASADWQVFDHDSARSGFASTDRVITAANVGGLHRRWVATFDAPGDGAPILVSNVVISPGHMRTFLYQETLIGTTYGIDALTGALRWKHTTQGPNITMSMPAEDPSGQWIYAPGVDGFVRRLLPSTGIESPGGGFPLRVTWQPQVEKDGTALNVANGFLYAATGGYLGDGGPYDGHVVTLNLQTGIVHVINSLCIEITHLIRNTSECPQYKSGIWARGGAVVDPDPSMGGRVYAATGNALFNANHGGHDYGDSVLAISADGSALLDSFTPTDYQQLENGDVDLGSTAPVMLPKQSASNTPLMAVEGGKDGILKLLNRQHLGRVGGELQDVVLGDSIFSAPAVWVDRTGVTWMFVGTSSAVTAYDVVTSGGVSSLNKVWASPLGGTSPVVANGVVFAATSGAVYALNARSGAMLWSSTQQSAGGSIGGVHWESPIVEKGWLYMSDENGNLSAYSL